MMVKKKVKFYYFQPMAKNSDGSLRIVNLSELFEKIFELYNAESSQKKVYEYKNEKSKLDAVYKHECYYYLTIDRLRDTNLPVRSKLDEDSKDLELEENEYLGEEVVVQYDSIQHVLMIQNNINSLSPRRIELFIASLLAEFSEEDIQDFKLSIICQKDVDKKRIASYARKITVKVMDDFNDREGIVGGLMEALRRNNTSRESAKEYSVELTISAKTNAKGEDAYLDQNMVHEIVSLSDTGEQIKKMKVKARNPFDKLEEINILDNKISDIVEFEISEHSRRLYPKLVCIEMRRIYEEQGKAKVSAI